jgi:hypothetical protein
LPGKGSLLKGYISPTSQFLTSVKKEVGRHGEMSASSVVITRIIRAAGCLMEIKREGRQRTTFAPKEIVPRKIRTDRARR